MSTEDVQTDGNGETSIPPYNKVVGGIIINKNCPSYLYDLINIRKHQYSFRYSTTTELPQVRTIRYGIYSFRYTASKLWNELPEHFRNETNFNQFSKLISTWTGNSCRCNACKIALLCSAIVSSF